MGIRPVPRSLLRLSLGLAAGALASSWAMVPATTAQGPPAQGPPPQSQPSAAPATPPAPIPWRPLPSPVPDDAPEESYAIHVKRAITVSGEPIDDATILVHGGKIVGIGRNVEAPKGAKHLDYRQLTAMPGLVVAVTRAGYAPRSLPKGVATRAKDGIDPEAEVYKWAARAGITTMGVVPAGGGIVGLATAISPRGKSVDEMVKKEDAYLFSNFELGTAAKDNFRQTFERAKDAIDAFEKAQKEAASRPTAAPGSAPASAPAAGPATQPAGGAPAPRPPAKLDAQTEILASVLKKEKKLVTQFGGGGGFGGGGTAPAPEVVHFTDAMKKFELDRVYVGGANLALVEERVSDAKAAVLMPAEESAYEPFTRIRLNGAAELHAAGVKVGFLPTADTRDGYQDWLHKVGEMVRYGFPAKDALRAVTLTPAEILGMADRIGSLAKDRDADILFLEGSPLDASAKVRHVMIGGELQEEDQ
jgi:amidohydrolase family protein